MTPTRTPPTAAPSAPESEAEAIRRDGSEIELSVVIPCLNEARTLGTCIEKAVSTMGKLGIRGEVVVADNGSTDGSIEIAERAGARVIRVPVRGYGNALMHGCTAARGRFILMADGDDSYDFRGLGPFVEKLREGYDLVMGTRLRGTIMPGAMPWKNRYIGNPALTGILRILFRAPISDAHCGMRAFTKEAFTRLRLRTPGMEFASEMVIKAAKLKLSMTDVPITFHPDGRDRAPHLRPWRDGWRHMKLMFMFSPTALFLVPGIVLVLLGLGLQLTQVLGPVDRPVRLFGFRLDFHWAILGSLMVLVGYQIVTTHFFARVYSVTHRLQEEDRILRSGFRLLTLGRVLTIAAIVMAVGLVMDGIVAVAWLRSHFGPLVSGYTRLFILGSTLVALGVQTFFNAFFFSMLGDAYKYGSQAEGAEQRVGADSA